MLYYYVADSSTSTGMQNGSCAKKLGGVSRRVCNAFAFPRLSMMHRSVQRQTCLTHGRRVTDRLGSAPDWLFQFCS